MSPFRLFSLLVLVLAWVPVQASARCAGANTLGALHDAYRATLLGEGAARQTAAATLLFMAGQQDSDALARRVAQSGAKVSSGRLADALADAEALATETLQFGRASDRDFRHAQNVQWLAEVFRRSNCQDSAPAANRNPVPAPGAVPLGAANRPSSRSRPKTSSPTTLIFVAMAAFAAGFGTYKLHTSFHMRRRRVERQPRLPISLPFEASFAAADGQVTTIPVKAVDISLGGMKLSWNDAPPSGTPVTLEGPQGELTCQITWSNSFYAGVMFDTPLSESELSMHRELSQAA